MRIVCYHFASGTFDQINTTQNYQTELRALGLDLSVVVPTECLGKGRSPGDYDDFIVETIKKEHKKKAIDVLFCHVRDNEMGPKAVYRIREFGVKVVNAVYDLILVPHRCKENAKAFDLFWVTEPEAIETLRGYGATVFHQPTAASPFIYKPHNITEDIDISFCGTRREGRPFYAVELYKRGISVDFFGKGWKKDKPLKSPPQQYSPSPRKIARHILQSLCHQHGRKWAGAAFLRRLKTAEHHSDIFKALDAHFYPPLIFDEMVKLYSRSKMSLGINELGHTYLLKRPLIGLRLRDFEAPMSGACYIMHRTQQMSECFDEGKEMLFYDSCDELADKIQFYLHPHRDTTRHNIKESARERALRDHTWKNRFGSLCEALGLRFKV